MTKFEFFMTFYGLLLGLGVAELLSGFANLLRAPVRPKLGWLTPVLGALLFVQIMTSFFDAFAKLQTIRLNVFDMALPTFIGVAFFTATVIVVPRRAEEWPSLDAYFFRQRRWTIGALLAASLATMLIELPITFGFVQAGAWFRLTFYVVANAVLIATLVIPLVARSPRIVLASLVANLILLIYFYSPLSYSAFASTS